MLHSLHGTCGERRVQLCGTDCAAVHLSDELERCSVQHSDLALLMRGHEQVAAVVGQSHDLAEAEVALDAHLLQWLAVGWGRGRLHWLQLYH